MNAETIVFDVFVIGLFLSAMYAFSILPRQRDFKRRQQLVSRLKPGTEVITYGGMVGRVNRVDSPSGVVYLDIADGVEVRVLAAAISEEFAAKVISENAQMGLKK